MTGRLLHLIEAVSRRAVDVTERIHEVVHNQQCCPVNRPENTKPQFIWPGASRFPEAVPVRAVACFGRTIY